MSVTLFPKIQSKEATRIFRPRRNGTAFLRRHSREGGNPAVNISLMEGQKLDSRLRGNDVLLLSLSLILIFLSPSIAHGTSSFGQASDILNIGAGARSLAMGSAFTGLADDASAPYFNPAGLAFLDEHQLMAMHAPLVMSSNYNYFSSAHPLGDKWGSIGFSGSLLLSNGFTVRDRFNSVTDANASFRNSSISASYAHKVTQRFSLGLNTTLLQQKVVGLSDTTVGYDAGVLYHPFSFLGVGLAFANINAPEITLQSSPDVYRPVTRFGLSSQVFQDRLVLTADAIKIKEQNNLYAAGAEFIPHRFVRFRGGFNANRSYTFGLGVKIKTFSIDYAFSDTDIGAFNKVSFTWAWHNIYKTSVEPPLKEGRAVYPLQGFENQVAFRTTVPPHVVARWSLMIKNKAGETVRTLEGDLRPPEIISWDAKNTVGEPVVDGVYNYTFLVKYKNGKEWNVAGNLQLALPKNEINEVIDMNLQLNGTKTLEVTVPPTPETPPAAPSSDVLTAPVQNNDGAKNLTPNATEGANKPAEGEKK